VPEDEARKLSSEEKRTLLLLKYRPVCICNTIRAPRVIAAIEAGAATVDQVAKATGCTTGDCGGERCIPVIETLLAESHKH
jgi:NAD(P)H-nitrite reductase large subunit